MLKTFLILLLGCIITLDASDRLPFLFEKQGTPLYKSILTFKLVENYPQLTPLVTNYINKALKTKEHGFNAQASDDKKLKINYLKNLRSLQKDHDKIIALINKMIITNIKEDNYEQFLNIIDTKIVTYHIGQSMTDMVLSYYKQKRHMKKNIYLDKLIVKNNNSTIYYSSTKSNYKSSNYKSNIQNDITIVTSARCKYCLKAKQYLNNVNESYTELDSKSSFGSKLMRQHNAKGVPLIIINNQVIKGYSKSRLEAALNNTHK